LGAAAIAPPFIGNTTAVLTFIEHEPHLRPSADNKSAIASWNWACSDAAAMSLGKRLSAPVT